MSEAKVALVTGGAQGLGAEISKVLLRAGYKVCVADIQLEKGTEFVHSLNKEYGAGSACFALCDVTNVDDFSRAIECSTSKLGKISLFINNAGILDEKNPEKMLSINLMGSVHGCQKALETMGKSNGGSGGTLIQVASITGFIYHSALPVYAASKHGAIGLIRSYGTKFHFDKDGVTFMAICPSLIDTDLLPHWSSQSAIDGYDVSNHPGVMKPEYVAQGILKLLKDCINGSTLLVSKERGSFYVDVQESVKPFLFQ